MNHILVCIPVHNRLHIARECIPTVQAGMARSDSLAIYDDGSSDNLGPLPGWPGDSYHRRDEAVGIERQRKAHFREFQSEKFTHLYLTDSDALHDPHWRDKALMLQKDAGGAPVCLYNTQAHERLPGNTVEVDGDLGIIWRRVAPGISYFLTADHVRTVCATLPHLPDHWNWDWTVPNLLGGRFAVSAVSYVDHVGHGGMHHPDNEGLDGGDRATGPTPWLIQKRAEVVAKLNAT